MILALLATVLASSAPNPPFPMGMQRASVDQFVAAYERTTKPVAAPYEAIFAGPDSTFTVGSAEAIAMSRNAQRALAACPTTAKRVAVMQAPAFVREPEREAFRVYIAAKASYYRQRCNELRAMVAFIDDPLKASNIARLEQVQSQAGRTHGKARARVLPVFKRVHARIPAGW